MGVRGLLKFLRTNPKARVQYQSMAKLTEERRRNTPGNKAVIVCDFMSILCWLIGWFHDARVKEGFYKQESFVFGGDYTEYSSRFISFMKALRYVCAEPILFVDGPRGSVLEDLNAKISTYSVNGRKRLHYIEKCLQFCEYDRSLVWNSEEFKKWRIYPLIVMQILMALRSEDIKVVHCLSEADGEMAEYTRVHPEVCGILTTDTDMVMMRKCTIIHCKFFDREDILGLRRSTFNEKPNDILCDLVTPESLASALHIKIEDLKIISIICGNDYTTSYELFTVLNLSHPFINSAAEWIHKSPLTPDVSKLFFDAPEIRQILSEFPDFYFAVQHTYKAYGEMESFEAMCTKCKAVQNEMIWHRQVSSESISESSQPVQDIVIQGIEKGEVTRTISSIVRSGIYWRIKFVEGQSSDESRKFVCVHDLILSLRKMIYQLLGVNEVVEYGHFTGKRGAANDRYIYPDNDCSNFLHRIRATSEINKILHLVSMIVGLETIDDFDDLQCAPTLPGYTPHTASQLKPVLLCSVLLYACSLAKKASTFDNPELATNVFLATCLMSVYGKPPLKIVERPTIDAVNMNTGFACIIEHVYDIASLFGLLSLLPPPGSLYQPAALVAFHQAAAAKPDMVKTKLKRSREFVELHTTYTHILQLRQFQRLKHLLKDFCKKCKDDHLNAMDLVCLAQTFYHVLGEYHGSVPELEGRIEELQALVTTEQRSPLKGTGKSKASKQTKQTKPKAADKVDKRKKSKAEAPRPFMDDMRATEMDFEQLQSLSGQGDTQTAQQESP